MAWGNKQVKHLIINKSPNECCCQPRHADRLPLNDMKWNARALISFSRIPCIDEALDMLEVEDIFED